MVRVLAGRWLAGSLTVAGVVGALGCRPNMALPEREPWEQPVGPGARAFDLTREVPGVGPVVERVLSRGPEAFRRGQCAGRIDLDIPGAPDGPQWYSAEVGCPAGVPRVRAGFRETRTGKAWLYEPSLERMMQARAAVLADRTEGVRWVLPELFYKSTSWTAVFHAVGLSPGGLVHVALDQELNRHRQLVAVLGAYQGQPAPGHQWDDVQVAVLDGRGEPLMALVLDPTESGTHAGVRLIRDYTGALREIVYLGLMRDALGAWRFVDLSLPVMPTSAQKPGGMQALSNMMLVAHDTEVLAPAATPAHLWIDGQPWFQADALTGLIDRVTFHPTLPANSGVAINPSPAQAPTWMLANASTNSARLAFDRTVMRDEHGFLVRLPPAWRLGWSHVHEQFSAKGERAMSTMPLDVASPVLSGRLLRLAAPRGRRVLVERVLVGARNATGELEYGLRETMTLE